MRNSQPSDHLVRARAIDPSQSFLIQAPAGSGKTELLTDRILALLATVDRPEEIVAITFTRKAASEMHARVLEKLRKGKEPPPELPHQQRSWELARQALQRNDELGWNLLHYPARLAIRTIDAFCAHLVRSMPWLSQLGGMPAIADNPGELYRAAAQATLDMVDDEPVVAALLEHLDVDGREALALLATGLAQRDQWLPLLDAADDATLLSHNLNHVVSQELDRLAAAMPTGWASQLAPCAASAAKFVAEQSGSFDIGALSNWDGTLFGTDPVDDLARWQALGRLLLTGEGTLRAKLTKTQGCPPKSDQKTALESWLGQVRPGTNESPPSWLTPLVNLKFIPPQGYTKDQLQTLETLLGALRLASAQLQLQFVQAGEVDFTEIAQRAVSALGRADDPSDLLLKLDASISHILIDEFQDTSHSQVTLLESLTAGWSEDDGHTLFVVGDPMQSIYRFRKAEVGLFLKVQELGLTNVSLTSLPLTDNFRSDKGVVDWVNSTFGPLFPQADNAALGAISYSHSTAFNDYGADRAVTFHPVWRAHGDDAQIHADSVRHTESLVVNLVRDALARHTDSKHPVAVLVRARTHLEGVLRALARNQIPCRAVELEALKSRQVIDDLVQLARALSHDGDRLAWLCMLRSPVCGLTLDSLHALFGADHSESVPSHLRRWLNDTAVAPALAADESRRLRRVATVLLDAGNRSGTIPFAAWLEQCWQRLGGAHVYAKPDDAADAERFFRLIDTLAPFGGLDPFELESRLDRLYASSGGSGPAVEVMTIHKAKGLEFDTVILMGLHRQPPADRPPLVRFELDDDRILLGPIKDRAREESDPVSDYLARREKQRGIYEIDRLLYVAATRARRQLHLVATVFLDVDGKPKAPVAGSLLAHLWDYMALPDDDAKVSLPDTAPRKAATSQRYLLRLKQDALADIRPDTMTVVPVGAGMPWNWSETAGDEAAIGSVAHAWLEHLGKHGIEHWSTQRIADCVPQFKALLSRSGVSINKLDVAAETVKETLQATLNSATGRWLLSAAKGYREWSLIDATGRVSVIDLALSDENGWLVVDYKTGRPGADEALARFTERMHDRYAKQIAGYCASLTALDGRPARGALYFPRCDLWIDC